MLQRPIGDVSRTINHHRGGQTMGMQAHIEVGVMRTGYSGSKPMAWVALTLALLLIVSDFVDRQIVASMLPILKSEWNLSDTQLGSLISIVSMTAAVFSVPVALLADRWSRVKSIVLMALLWSLATIVCAFATDYTQLLAARAFVGLGEAGYTSVGAALLAGLFPSAMRARILASFAAAAAIGAVIGVVLGGVLSKAYGWQAAFGIVGAPGLVFALLFLVVPDDRSGETAGSGGNGALSRLGFRATISALLATPSALLIYIGYAVQLFVIATVYAWLPSFLNRSYGLAPDQAAIRAALVLIVSSLAAVLWGTLADRVARKHPRNKIWVMAGSAAISAIVLPAAFAVFSPGPAQIAMIMLGSAFMTGSIGTVNAVALDVAHRGVSATTIAVGSLIGALFGLAAGPVISGKLSDAYGLTTTLSAVPALGLVAAMAMIAIFRLYDRDLAKAGEPQVAGSAVA